jgi:hypothetical protein
VEGLLYPNVNIGKEGYFQRGRIAEFQPFDHQSILLQNKNINQEHK